jgi:hypothetical protein
LVLQTITQLQMLRADFTDSDVDEPYRFLLGSLGVYFSITHFRRRELTGIESRVRHGVGPVTIS